MNGDFTIIVEKADVGRRLDTVIAAHLSDCSRSLAATLIAGQKVLVDRRPQKPGYRTKLGDRIRGYIPIPEPAEYDPEPIPLDILYQDRHIIVINKQPGLVVHPAPGHGCGTLVNALLHHCPDLSPIGGEIRPGIVHRLDKDTSGTMIVAKTAQAQENLARQFKARAVQKNYLALVFGDLPSETGEIKAPIGRHPVDRKRMSTTTRKGRDARTTWKVRERYIVTTLLELTLKTGRTHQIRVHCTAMGHPIIGDRVYHSGKRLKDINRVYSGKFSVITAQLKAVPRQMLHAWRLGVSHPHSGKDMSFESPIPTDMQTVIQNLRQMVLVGK